MAMFGLVFNQLLEPFFPQFFCFVIQQSLATSPFGAATIRPEKAQLVEAFFPFLGELTLVVRAALVSHPVSKLFARVPIVVVFPVSVGYIAMTMLNLELAQFFVSLLPSLFVS